MKGFAYASEKFSAAMRALMLPHPRGDADSIMHAFHECTLGLMGIDKDELDDFARDCVDALDDFMDPKDFSDADDAETKGAWVLKAETFSVDQKLEISRLVDSLALWFKDQLRGD